MTSVVGGWVQNGALWNPYYGSIQYLHHFKSIPWKIVIFLRQKRKIFFLCKTENILNIFLISSIQSISEAPPFYGFAKDKKNLCHFAMGNLQLTWFYTMCIPYDFLIVSVTVWCNWGKSRLAHNIPNSKNPSKS